MASWFFLITLLALAYAAGYTTRAVISQWRRRRFGEEPD